MLGTISYMIDGNEFKSQLVASHDVEKSKLFYYMIEILIGLILIFIVYLILSYKKKEKIN